MKERKEERKEGREEGRKEGKEGRKEGRKEGSGMEGGIDPPQFLHLTPTIGNALNRFIKVDIFGLCSTVSEIFCSAFFNFRI